MSSRQPESTLLGWERYKQRLQDSAFFRGYPQDAISKILAYGENLNTRSLPVIFNLEHLSLLVGYQPGFLAAVASATERFYREFWIPKKGRPGSERRIAEPLPSLKEIQRWILQNILNQMNASRFAKGYIRGIGTRHGARIHRGQPILVRIDIKDFFGSIRAKRIFWIFRSRGFAPRLASLFTNICTLRGALPQGAPTSASLSNLAMLRADARIAGFALKRGLRYTRYADDLSLSGETLDVGELISFVEMVLRAEGLLVNESKTRVMRKDVRQTCTGLTVNTTVNVSRPCRRKFRQEVFFIRRFGIKEHIARMGSTRSAESYLEHLIGTGNYIMSVNTHLRRVGVDLEFLHSLRKEMIFSALG